MSRYEDYGSGDSRRSPRDRDRSPGRYNDGRDSSHFRGPSRGNDGPRRIDGRANSDAFISSRDNFRGSISREDPRDFPSRDPPRAPRAVLDAPAGPRASSYGDFRGRGRGRGRGYRDDSRDRGWIDDRPDYRDRRDVRRDSRGGPVFRSDDRSRDREWRDRETFRNRRPSPPTGRGRSPDLRDIRDGPASVASDRLGRSSREGPPAIPATAPDLVLASPGFQSGYPRPGRGRGWGRGQPVDDRDRGRGRSRSPDLRGRDREDREREAARYKRERERVTEAREQRSPPPQAPQVPAFGSISIRSGSISGPVPAPGPEAPESNTSASLRRLSDVPIPTGPKAQRQRFSGTHPGRPVSKTWVRPASPVSSAPPRVKKNNVTIPLQQPTRKLPPSEDDLSESDSADDLNDDYFDLEHKRLGGLLEKAEAQQMQSTIKPVLPCDVQSELRVDAHLAIDIMEEGDKFDRSGPPPLPKAPEPQSSHTNGSNSTTVILPPTMFTVTKREEVVTPSKQVAAETAMSLDVPDDIQTPRSPLDHDPLTVAMKKKKVGSHDAQNEAMIPIGPGRQDRYYGEGPILPPKARAQDVQRETILPPKVSTVILPPVSHGHSVRKEPILPPSRIVPTSEAPISRASGNDMRNEPILPPKRPRENDSLNQPSMPSAVHVQNHENGVITASGPLKQEPVYDSGVMTPQPHEPNGGVHASGSQTPYASPVFTQAAVLEVAEEKLIVRPTRRPTPLVSSLPFPADEVPFYKNPTFIAGWTPDLKIKEAVMQDLKMKSRKELEERDAMAIRYAKDYEVYLKDIGWPNGEKAKNGTSAQHANGTGGSGTNEGRPEGRRNASRFASQHELERILKESELEAEKQRTKKLVEDLTGSDPAKEAVIPPVKTIDQEKLEHFVDRNNLIRFEDSFRAFEVLQPVDNFTPEECETFEKAFFDYPKQWAKIAECLPGRDFGTCIQHYYLVKHSLELNKRLKEQRKRRKRKTKSKKPVITAEEAGPEEGTDTAETTGLRRRPPRGAKNQEQPTYASEVQPSESENNTPVPTPAKRGTGNGKREVSEAAPDSKRSKDTPTRGRTTKRGRGRSTAIVPGQRAARSPSQSNAEPPKSARPSQPPSRSRTPMTSQSVQLDGVAPETILPPYPPLAERQNIVSSTPDITPFSYVPPPQERTENVPPAMTFDHQQQQDRRALQQTSSYWSVPEQQDFPALLKHFGTDWNGIAKWMTSKTHIMVKNYYQRQVESGKPEYAEFAATADRKRDRGESTGPPPTPSMAPKRRYDGPPAIMPRSGELTMPGFEEYNTQQPPNMQQSAPPQPIISTRFPALAQAGPVQNDPPYPIPLPKKQTQPQPKQNSQTPPVSRTPTSRGPHLGYFNPDRERPILQASTSHHAPVSSPMQEASVSQRSRQVAQEAQMEREQALRQQQRQEQVRLEQQRAAEQQRMEQQRAAEQQQQQQQHLERERQQRIEQQQQRLEQQRLEQQRLEQQRLEQQRLEQQRLEEQRLNQQRIDQQRLEQQQLLERQRLEQQQRQQERQMRLKQEKDMLSSPHQYERYSAYPQQPGVMAPSRMESAVSTPVPPPDMRRTAPPQQFAPRSHQSMRSLMSDSPGPSSHVSSSSPSPAITRAPFSAPPDQIQAMQSPAIAAARQQETPRKTSSIMSLLNDEPIEPKPAPPKRVSEVATSSVKPSQSPTQMYAQAGRSPVQMYQQQPSQSPSQMYQHRSQSPAPIYQQTSIQQNRYAAPPPQHVSQQMAPQSSSPLTGAPVSERDYYSRPYAGQGAPQQMSSQHQVSHSQPAYSPGPPHHMQPPRQSMTSQPPQTRREPVMPNSMRLVESPYSAAAQAQPPRPVYSQPQPQSQRAYTPYESRGFAPPPPQQQLNQAQEQQMQQEMYRRQQLARQQEEENYRRGYGR